MFNFNVADASGVRAVLLGATAIMLVGAPLGGVAARVGVTSATDGDPLGKPPTEAERVLRIGFDVQTNEVITTKANDRAHLVFLDGTSLTIGPDAQVTIDKFVYDPNTKKGELAINAGKGVFRLVGGKISKNDPIIITTPSSTIGIRGGITIFTVKATSTTSTFVFGSGMTVTSGGQTQTVTRPGFTVTASGGAAPAAPTAVGVGGLSSQLSALEGGSQSSGPSGGSASGSGQAAGGGSTGSSTNNASADQKVASSGFSSTNSSQSPSSVSVNTPVLLGPKSNDSNTATQAISNAGAANQPQEVVVVAPPAPSGPPTTVIVTQGRFLAEPPYSSFNSTTLAAPRTSANNQPLALSGSVQSGKATITTSDGRSMVVPWLPGTGFNFTGDTPFGPATATGIVSATQDFFAYVFTDSAGKKFGVFGGAPTTLSNIPKTGFATHILTNTSGVSGNLPFANSTVGSDASLKAAATISPLYSAYAQTLGIPISPFGLSNERATSLQTTVAISGEGGGQRTYHGAYIGTYFADYNTNSVMNSGGYAASYRLGGQEKIGRLTSAMTTADTPQGNAIYGPNGDNMVYLPDSARSTIEGGVGSTLRTPQAALNQPYTNLNGSDYYPITLATKTPSIAVAPDLGQSRTTQTMNGYVGGVIEASNGEGTFSTRLINVNGVQPTNVSISTDAATNRAQGTIMLANFGASPNVIATFEMGSLTGPNQSSSAFIDDRRYGMADRTGDPSRFSKVTTVPGGTDIAINSRTILTSYDSAPVALPGGVTACDCLFMSWGWWSGDIRYDTPGFRQGQRDRLNLATYVVGNLSNAVQLPNTGSATYSGHAFGNVVNGPNSYVAAGSYTNMWNFATQRGQVTIGNFDGATYSGQTALTNGTVNFTGPITGAGRSGNVSGSFYRSPTDPVAGQGGSFAVTGQNYKAGGTFVGKR